jgi:transaldolase
MQLYLESASLADLREALSWRVIDGVNTNPTLLSREEGDPHEILAELCTLVGGPVMAEVIATDTQGMIEEAETLANIHERIVVKVPCVPAGIPAIAALAERRIPVDATLCFSLPQALLAAKAGARYVSPYVGRLDEAGGDGLALVGNIIATYDQYDIKTRVLAADLRHPGHVAEAARMGADASSFPLALLRQLADHPLTEQGRLGFRESWRRAQN